MAYVSRKKGGILQGLHAQQPGEKSEVQKEREKEMTAEVWVEQSREKKRRQFGKVGVHDDCIYCEVKNGTAFCDVCGYVIDGYGHTTNKLPCEFEVCYFYDQKRKDDDDD